MDKIMPSSVLLTLSLDMDWKSDALSEIPFVAMATSVRSKVLTNDLHAVHPVDDYRRTLFPRVNLFLFIVRQSLPSTAAGKAQSTSTSNSHQNSTVRLDPIKTLHEPPS